jgi:hypothetical protein
VRRPGNAISPPPLSAPAKILTSEIVLIHQVQFEHNMSIEEENGEREEEKKKLK